MVSTILNALLTTVAEDAVGKLTKKRISKTKVTTHASVFAGFYALLPTAMHGDNAAIGALVVMTVSGLWALIDRWRKDKEK